MDQWGFNIIIIIKPPLQKYWSIKPPSMEHY
jgi:hypothetical protein